ncbi:hypothetical protein ACHQM5_021893 [Ranunculus cassubicifolius]
MVYIKSFRFLSVIVLVISLRVTFVLGQAGCRGLLPIPLTGQERCQCPVRGRCNRILTCPIQCPLRKPSLGNVRGCFINCGVKCEDTCRSRVPGCDDVGSVCYDPRFIGGDGRLFYFYGSKGGDIALFSDDNLHINAHFIGTRPEGRTRDFTWVQALSVMFDTHTLVVSAKKVSEWHESVDALVISYDGEIVDVPMEGDAEWHASTNNGREVIIERTNSTNSVKISITDLLEVNVKVRAIGSDENRVHKYQLPEDDVFAHLETAFRFVGLTDHAEGVLGKTYRADYVSPVKTGVDMPIMGGEDKYRAPSLLSPMCKLCRFKGHQSAITQVNTSN